MTRRPRALLLALLAATTLAFGACSEDEPQVDDGTEHKTDGTTGDPGQTGEIQD